jgi:hypothetical protein
MQAQHSPEEAAAAAEVPVEGGTAAAAAELLAEPGPAPLEAATSPGETALAVAEPSPGPPTSGQEGAEAEAAPAVADQATLPPLVPLPAWATPAVAQEAMPPPQEGAAGAKPPAAEVPLPPPPLPLPADASPEEELHWASEQLRSLGYQYTENDELRAVADGGVFQFRGQPHYERLGLAVEAYVQALLRSRFGMLRHFLADHTPVFATPDLETRSGALVLLCGGGRVAAGQWARRLCINQSLATGAVFNYIRDAQAAGLSVLILNPNDARSSERHCAMAWRTVLEPCAETGRLRHVALVAHSYGGVCTVAMLGDGAPQSVLQLLRGVALTDSVHGRGIERCSPEARDFFSTRCVNWVTSDQPLNSLVAAAMNSPPKGAAKRLRALAPLFQPAWCDTLRLSAGTDVHESTSEACRVPAMRFLRHKLTQAGWQSDEVASAAAAQAADPVAS